MWNKPVDKLPMRKDSRTLVNSIGATQYQLQAKRTNLVVRVPVNAPHEILRYMIVKGPVAVNEPPPVHMMVSRCDVG